MNLQSKTRVMIVDDHAVIRDGLAELIQREADFAVCAGAGSLPEALDALRQAKPDIAVVDISLGDADGLRLVRILADRGIPALVLSMHDERIYAERALRAGAKGYVMKQEATSRIVDGLRRVREGRLALSTAIEDLLQSKMRRGKLTEDAPPVARLTNRELEVFRLIGQGVRVSEIAERLHLSVKTVETHRENIKNKLGVPSAAELAQFAVDYVHTHAM